MLVSLFTRELVLLLGVEGGEVERGGAQAPPSERAAADPEGCRRRRPWPSPRTTTVGESHGQGPMPPPLPSLDLGIGEARSAARRRQRAEACGANVVRVSYCGVFILALLHLLAVRSRIEQLRYHGPEQAGGVVPVGYTEMG